MAEAVPTFGQVELESFVIVLTAPLWFLAFVVLFVAGAVGDWRRTRG